MKNTYTTEERWKPSVRTTRKDQATPQAVSIPKPLRPLTRKQAAFVKHILDNPKASAAAAATAAYNVSTGNSARQLASENLTKPNILQELAKHSGTAELVLLEVMQQSRKKMMEDDRQAVDWAVNARQTADSLLDRVHGKAKQTVETTSTAVTISIDLTGVSKENIE